MYTVNLNDLARAHYNAELQEGVTSGVGSFVAQFYADSGLVCIAEARHRDSVSRLFTTMRPMCGSLERMAVSEVYGPRIECDYPVGDTFYGYPIIYSPERKQLLVVSDDEANFLEVAPPLDVYPIRNRR